MLSVTMPSPCTGSSACISACWKVPRNSQHSFWDSPAVSLLSLQGRIAQGVRDSFEFCQKGRHYGQVLSSPITGETIFKPAIAIEELLDNSEPRVVRLIRALDQVESPAKLAPCRHH